MIEYGFFDSELSGYDDEGFPVFDRAKSSEFFADFWKRLVSDGVLGQPSDCFQVLSTGGMNISVRPGFGFIQGHYAKDEQTAVFEIEPVTTGKRIDLVVFRLNRVERMIEIIIKKGIASNNPVKPALIREPYGDYYELCLAEITVDGLSAGLTQTAISDTRMNSNVCGIVVCPINKLDTTVFYDQINSYFAEFKTLTNSDYANFKVTIDNKLAELTQNLQNFYQNKDTEFNTWFDSIKNILSGDVAGNLLNEINKLKEDKADKSVSIQATISASTWTGTSSPFMNRVPISDMKALYDVEIKTEEDPSDEQIQAFATASIQYGYTEDGYLVLKAYGDKPEIDLPIMVIVRGDLCNAENIVGETIISGGTFADWSK